jgi:hypothetical protein
MEVGAAAVIPRMTLRYFRIILPFRRSAPVEYKELHPLAFSS